MSTSANEKRTAKTLIVYLAFSLFCGVFSIVYESFSHGVYSGYMIFLFTVPLIGAIPYAALLAVKPPRVPSRSAYNIYNAGVAAIAAGTALKGVFEIYGTAVDHLILYFIVGAAEAAAGVVLYIIDLSKKENGTQT